MIDQSYFRNLIFRIGLGFFMASCGIVMFAQNAESQVSTDAVKLTVDLSVETGPMNPAWAWFGYDEPNYTYLKDGKKLLSEIAALSPVPVIVRTHNLLTTGDGSASLKWGSTKVLLKIKTAKQFMTGRYSTALSIRILNEE